MKRIAILGSTGSIGCSALAVIDAHPQRLQITGLAAGENVEKFALQVERYRPRAIAMATGAALTEVRQALATRGALGFEIAASGVEGLIQVATQPEVDVVLCASAGTAALEAVLAAIEAGKTIALANKEVLVMAGGLVMQAARRHNAVVLPVDSEHSAIHQCLSGRSPSELRRLILTASGGPFRDWPMSALDGATPEDALRHPTWRMGPKITVDSATLMNKGLEVIEARWLFDMPGDRVDVVIHPQSIVHSMIELCDGSIIAQLGVADMRVPIQYAFAYPDRWEAQTPPLDLTSSSLEFARPDLDRFPCLGLAYRAVASPPLAVALNAANEVAVQEFLDGRLSFPAIPGLIERVMRAPEAALASDPANVAEVRALDRWARAYSLELAQTVKFGEAAPSRMSRSDKAHLR